MKKLIFSILIAFTGLITLQSFDTIGFGKKDGTEPGYTGSPGDSLKNCTACHGGTAVVADGWIVSTVPSTGFVPGQRYTITATNTEHGATRFGFSISPQALDGTQLGEMIITDTTTTKLVGDGKYATYRADGVDGIDSRSWSFDWIAPTGVNEVIFYGAFNSNADGHKEGDHTYLSTLRLYKNGFTGIAKSFEKLNINVYPTFASQKIYIKAEQTETVQIRIIGLNGQLAANWGTQHLFSGNETSLDVSDIANGVYILHIQNGNQTSTHKILINH